MVYEQTRLSRPLSRIELTVSIILICLFIGIFIRKILVLTAAAEATALELMIRNMRSGVMVKVADLIVKGDYQGIAELAKSNPMSVLETPAGVYKGILPEGDSSEIEAGKWYYDKEGKQLIYDVVNTDYFITEGSIPGRIRVRFRLNYEDRNNNGNYDSGTDIPRGVSIDVMDKYRWTY